jgi:acyl-CoA reductase-like NAD-dependent aldehyde dehydrogenase
VERIVDMPMAKEEAFGPVAALIRGESLDQAIEWINTKTNLGHTACLMTREGRNARKFIREVNVGNVGINVGVAQPYAFFPPWLEKRIVCWDSQITDGFDEDVYGREDSRRKVDLDAQVYFEWERDPNRCPSPLDAPPGSS